MELQTANIHDFTIKCKKCGREAVTISTIYFRQADVSGLTIHCDACKAEEEFKSDE